jgi:hypothetical protein
MEMNSSNNIDWIRKAATASSALRIPLVLRLKPFWLMGALPLKEFKKKE